MTAFMMRYYIYYCNYCNYKIEKNFLKNDRLTNELGQSSTDKIDFNNAAFIYNYCFSSYIENGCTIEYQ